MTDPEEKDEIQPPNFEENPPVPSEVGESTVLRTDLDLPDSIPLKPGRVPVLIVLEGPSRNLRFALRADEMTLGRDPGADLTLEDSKVSRFHARIQFTNRGDIDQIPDCRLYDLDSTNGTFVNGEEVLDPEGVWLQDRDRIRVGNTVLGLFFLDEEAVPLV